MKNSQRPYFVKSLEEDFVTKTIKGKKKVNYQTVANMIKTKTIKLNTKSFGRNRRLACTLLHKNYTKTYRAQGIIFQTNDKPDHMAPFDLLILSNADKIIVQYYRIQNNLHEYYSHDLIKGFNKFIFKDFKKMLKEFPSPEAAWKKVNKFRKDAGFKRLGDEKKKLVLYNEVIFEKPVKITPIAIYGYRKEAREMAKKLKLPHFRSAKAFYESLKQ